MRVLDLFSGIGGVALGLHRAGMTTAAFCEIEPFQRAVLEKNFPGVKIYDDIKHMSIDVLRLDRIVGSDAGIDIIAGGFPCQDISVAGKGAGIENGTRSGLWAEMFRLIVEVRPRWVLAENVPALRTRGADRVISDLEAAGYTVWASVVGAWAVGAPHKRDRAWIVAHRNGDGLDRIGSGGILDGIGQALGSNFDGLRERVDDAASEQDRRIFQRGFHTDAGAASSGMGNAEESRWNGEPTQGSGEHSEPSGTTRGSGISVGLADTSDERREERHGAGRRHAWPARPGQPQYEHESPRLLEFGVGGTVDGLSERLVRFANRNSLKSYGNSVVPQVVEIIGRAIMEAER